MEDLRNLCIDYYHMDKDNKTICLIINLEKNRGWKIFIKENKLILDHNDFKEKQPPIINLYDKVNNNDITYVNENPFAILFKTNKIWKSLDEKGEMKMKKIQLKCFN